MKLDLLKKLTALANNNPNEHEANLAARRVCKMLAESKFDLRDDPVIPKSTSSQPGTWTGFSTPDRPSDFDVFYEYMFGGKHRRWAPPNNPPQPEYGKADGSGKSTKQEPFKSYRPSAAQESYFDGFSKAKRGEKRELKCKICGKTAHTRFVGPPEVFECNDCQWTAYIRTKVK